MGSRSLPTAASVMLTMIGAVVLVVGGWLVWAAWFADGPTASADRPEPAAASAAQLPSTHTMRSRAGGFAVAVPEGMRASHEGRTIRISSRDHAVVVDVGPSERGTLARTNRHLVAAMRHSEQRAHVWGHDRQRVDGHRALATYGRGRNGDRVRLRWVLLTVRAHPVNYTISTYAAMDADPGSVLPRVQAVAEGFRLLHHR